RQEHELHPGLTGFLESSRRGNGVEWQRKNDVGVECKGGLDVGQLLGAVESGRGGGDDLDPKAGELVRRARGDRVHEVRLIVPEQRGLQTLSLQFRRLRVVDRYF